MQVLFKVLQLLFVGCRAAVTRPELAERGTMKVGIVAAEIRAGDQLCRWRRGRGGSRLAGFRVVAAAEQQEQRQEAAHYRDSVIPKIWRMRTRSSRPA